MSTESPRYDFDRVFRLLLSSASIAIVFWLLSLLGGVLVPFVVAVLVAYMLNPIVNAFEGKTGGRGSAVALTLAVVLMAVLVSVPFVAYLVVQETADIVEVLSDDKIKQDVLAQVERIELFDVKALKEALKAERKRS